MRLHIWGAHSEYKKSTCKKKDDKITQLWQSYANAQLRPYELVKELAIICDHHISADIQSSVIV